MKLEQYVIKYITDKGMFENQAKEVYEMLISEKFDIFEPLMHKNMGDYPPMFSAIIELIINEITMKWIKANKPKAWFRPMFEEV